MLSFQISAILACMGTAATARERARAELTAEIVAEARRQLADAGAAGLSLRAVARALGMASSAVYRYFASRDELLTRLIIEAYDSLGAVAEAAAAASTRRSPRNRWVAVATSIRSWAIDHPHEYALVYGTPVPGYEAPTDTTASGVRVSLALFGIVADAARTGALTPPDDTTIPPGLRRELAALRSAIDADHVSDEATFATMLAWTQLFGLLSFELFSQTRGVVTDHERFFIAAVTEMAARIGL